MSAAITKTVIAAAAVIFASTGVVICLPPAAAEPCNGWGFPGKDMVIIEDGTGWTVSFNAGAKRFSLPARAENSKTGESPRTGTITGGMTSPTELSMTVVYPEGTQIYTGSVGGDGRARGVTANPPFDGIGWQTGSPLLCYDKPEAPATLSPEAPKKAPPPPQEQAPTNAISVNITDTAGGLKVNVNNSSSVAGNCTYDATAPNSPIPPTHRDFTVGAKAGTSLQINGIRTGTTFNTVTVCRGTFQGQDVEIGRVEIAKTF